MRRISDVVAYDESGDIPKIILGNSSDDFVYFSTDELREIVRQPHFYDSEDLDSIKIEFEGPVSIYGDASHLFDGRTDSGTKHFVFDKSLECLDTADVTSMSYMFDRAEFEELIDFSGFDTSGVDDMSGMFYGVDAEHIDISSFDTSNVADMSSMFDSCTAASINIGNLDMSNVKYFADMFDECKNLKTVDLSGCDMSSHSDLEEMFCEASSLESVVFPSDPERSVSVSGAHLMFCGCESLKHVDFGGMHSDDLSHTGSMFCDCRSLEHLTMPAFSYSGKDSTAWFMFDNCKNLKTVDLSAMNFDDIGDIHYIFNGCTSLEKMDLSMFSPEAVVDSFFEWDDYDDYYHDSDDEIDLTRRGPCVGAEAHDLVIPAGLDSQYLKYLAPTGLDSVEGIFLKAKDNSNIRVKVWGDRRDMGYLVNDLNSGYANVPYNSKVNVSWDAQGKYPAGSMEMRTEDVIQRCIDAEGAVAAVHDHLRDLINVVPKTFDKGTSVVEKPDDSEFE